MRLSGMGEALTIQHVFELVLRLKQICNFDPVTGVEQQDGTSGGGSGGSGRQRQEGDRVQPMGQDAGRDSRAVERDSGRWNTTARSRRANATR